MDQLLVLNAKLNFQDSNRRLVASNINNKVKYECVMNNNAFGREDNKRVSHFYIGISDAPADFSISVTRVPQKIHVLKPNQVGISETIFQYLFCRANNQIGRNKH